MNFDRIFRRVRSQCRFALRRPVVLLASIGVCAACYATPGGDEEVLVTATVDSSPAPRIILSFAAAPISDSSRKITGYTIHKRLKDDPNGEDWKLVAANLPADATGYTNSGPDVTVGSAYEYRVTRAVQYSSPTGVSGTTDLHGYIFAGVELPPEKAGYDVNHSRGVVLLIVDRSVASDLAKELSILEQDLAGDGWTVQTIHFPRGVAPNNPDGSPNPAYGKQVATLKSLIQTVYNRDGTNVHSVFLLGHLPVPYSGNQNPDNHPYQRAWPTDTYYGTVTNANEKSSFTWTDTRQDFESRPPFTAKNSNHPGDGKFDNGSSPLPILLNVGRVDLYDLPAFPVSETQLLRRYLIKDHKYRNKLTTYELRALIRNQFSCHTRPWATFTTFFGKDHIVDAGSGEWFPLLGKGSYVWAYGAGNGDCLYECATGIGSTSDFASKDARAVFMCLFGSFFGDWDVRNSFLRAPLGNNDTLTCTWHSDDRCFDSLTAGWVPPLFHHMAMGETIGYCVRLTQNYPTAYRKSANMVATRPISISLMGDPTLRLHVVAPPSGLSARAGSKSTVVLNWTGSPELPPGLKGYYVYRAADPKGAFTLLNRTNLLSAATTSYTDDSAATTQKWYMVRAAKREVSASGTYYNLSQGAFASVQ